MAKDQAPVDGFGELSYDYTPPAQSNMKRRLKADAEAEHEAFMANRARAEELAQIKSDDMEAKGVPASKRPV